MKYNPDKEIYKYCKNIVKYHTNARKNPPKTKSPFWDYPAMACICHDYNCTTKASSYSHQPYSTRWHSMLSSVFKTFGPIGSKHYGKCKLGQCAEQHAGNIYLNNHGSINTLYDLFFSKAMRPRTKEIFDPCQLCQSIFPNL